MKTRPIYETQGRREEAVWRVPIGDLYETNDQGTVRATSAVAQDYHDCLQVCKQFTVMSYAEFRTPAMEQARESDDAQLYRFSTYNMVNKRPILSQQGYVGMGPTAAQPGDVIVIFLGSRIPHVLRPKGGQEFAFLGEAYCDGLMDGELVGQRQQQTFSLV